MKKLFENSLVRNKEIYIILNHKMLYFYCIYEDFIYADGLENVIDIE